MAAVSMNAVWLCSFVQWACFILLGACPQTPLEGLCFALRMVCFAHPSSHPHLICMTMQFCKWPIKLAFDWPFCQSKFFSLYCTLPGDLKCLPDDLNCLLGELNCLLDDLNCLLGDLNCLLGDLNCLLGDLNCLLGDLNCLLGDLNCLLGLATCKQFT